MELFWILLCLVGISICLADKEGLPSDPESETAQLVRAFRGGDEQAFNRLVRLFQTRTYNLALTYLKDSEEAKDTTQDIFVTVYKAIHSLNDDTKFSAWLYQLSLNHCRNRYKQLRRRGFYNSQPLEDTDHSYQLAGGVPPEQALERETVRRLVRRAIAEMSETEKEILILRDLQGLSYEEISAVMEIPLGTVKSRLNRARAALKDRLRRYF